ncbi:MAG: hypothetical protein LC689_22580 [Myxococcales bacterium]|nr:hypothetical protein [Myxococcales bacterium]
MPAMRKARGLTFITVLIIAGAIALVGWIVTYGPAYWDNTDVSRMLKEAANMCYREPDDEKVKNWVMVQLHRQFETGERDNRGDPVMSIDVQRDDLRIERTDGPPKYVNIWLTYYRTVTVPLLGQQRQVTFVDHAEQDLTPVKW